MSETKDNCLFKVIIVDDSPDIVSRLTKQIGNLLNLELLEPAKNAAEALAAIEEQAPDIAIIDMELPDGSGLDLVKKIRKFNRKAKLIMLSTLEGSEYENSSRNAGADYFLSKNHDIDRLLEILESYIKP